MTNLVVNATQLDQARRHKVTTQESYARESKIHDGWAESHSRRTLEYTK